MNDAHHTPLPHNHNDREVYDMKHWPIRTEAIDDLSAGSVIRSTRTNRVIYFHSDRGLWHTIGAAHDLATRDITRDAPFVVLDVVDMDAGAFAYLLPEDMRQEYWASKVDEYLSSQGEATEVQQ